VPNSFATPDSKAPISLELPMKIAFTEETRPSRCSGGPAEHDGEQIQRERPEHNRQPPHEAHPAAKALEDRAPTAPWRAEHG
jgi:hypothetical protein